MHVTCQQLPLSKYRRTALDPLHNLAPSFTCAMLGKLNLGHSVCKPKIVPAALPCKLAASQTRPSQVATRTSAQLRSRSILAQAAAEAEVAETSR